jgi:predicted ATPase/class 3 adenylate cyclase
VRKSVIGRRISPWHLLREGSAVAVTQSDRAGSPLAIRLFGPFEARWNGGPLPHLRSRKGQWLFALLALRAGQEVERAWLAGVLWPDSSEAQALANLRNSLTDLRGALGEEEVRLRSPTPRTLCLDLAGAEIDVLAFDAAVANGDALALERAVALYRGPLLEGCTEEWAFQERQVREQAYLHALETLAAAALAGGDPATAERYLRLAVAVDPLRESAQRALLHALAAGGNYAAALLAYRELRLRLHRDLHAEPDPETTALFQQIRLQARGKAGGASAHPTCSVATPIPEDTVTFLFTDVEGSTRLWEQHPDAMREALLRHDTLLHHAIEVHGGHVFKTFGDQFCAAFATAPDALEAALAAQRTLQAEPWEEVGSLRVRMALHTGAAEVRESDYFGPPLNRVAHLLAAAHGGQVLFSLAAAELVRDHLPEGASLRDMGERRLQDLVRPERIFQLVTPELPADFPPLRSLEAFPNNLPLQLTSFIGRGREMEEVKRLLGIHRLLTLTGAGGCGKTRLALQVAADRLAEYADGAWFVDLAPLADPTLVPQAVAATLGVLGAPGRPLVETLSAVLKSRQLLLVLDNCEHLLAACAGLADRLLQSCPHLRILATSRERLGITGETPYRVPPLSLPDLRQPPTLASLTQYEAVRLFIERALTALSTFTVTNANAPFVAQVCHRLDGIPLAIELAAARVRVLPVEQIATRLDDRFRLLTGGSRTALPRQQTLRALIDWSYDLLSAAERTLLTRLSVFAGGWTLEAAEAVCADDDRRPPTTDHRHGTSGGREGGRWAPADAVEGRGQVPASRRVLGRVPTALPRDYGHSEAARVGAEPTTQGDEAARVGPTVVGREDVLELLGQLVDKSLVLYEAQGREARYRLLETVRQYGRDRLLEAGEAEAVRGRHGHFFLRLAEAAEPQLRGPEQLVWLDHLEAEHDNLRAALDACQEEDGAALEVRLAGALWWFWANWGHFAEGQRHIERALSRGEGLPPSWRAKVLQGAFTFARWQGDHALARSFGEESLALSKEAGDRWGMAYSLFQLGILSANHGDNERAKALGAECLALARQIGDPWLIAYPLLVLGAVARDEGDHERAMALLDEGLALARQAGDRYTIAMRLMNLGLTVLGQGNTEQAGALCREGLVLCQELKNQLGIALCLGALAGVAGAEGRAEQVPRLLGAVAGLLEAIGGALLPGFNHHLERHLTAARAALGEDEFAAAWAEGRVMSLEQAVALALAE